MSQSVLIDIIIFFTLWFIALLISGLLGWSYQIKHQKFVKFRDEITKYINELDKNNIALEEISISYELPKNEIAYVYNKKVTIINKAVNNKKSKLKKNKDNYSDLYYDDQYVYKIFNKEKKIFFLDKDEIYATNLRVMISLNDKYIQIPYNEIENMMIKFLYNDKKYFFSFVIKKENDIFIIKTDDIDNYWKIKKIWKEKK